jgi:importin subunit alpha-6/7
LSHPFILSLPLSLTLRPSQILQTEATWALMNIASGTTEHAATIVDGGAIPPLIRLLHSSDLDLVEEAVLALGNIAGDNVGYRDILMASEIIHEFASLEEVQ